MKGQEFDAFRKALDKHKNVDPLLSEAVTDKELLDLLKEANISMKKADVHIERAASKLGSARDIGGPMKATTKKLFDNINAAEDKLKTALLAIKKVL